VCYPKLADLIKKDPRFLFDTTPYIEHNFPHDDYISFSERFKSMDQTPPMGGSNYIKPVLTVVLEDEYLYKFLRSIAKSFILNGMTSDDFRSIIFRTGLVG